MHSANSTRIERDIHEEALEWMLGSREIAVGDVAGDDTCVVRPVPGLA